MFGGTINGGVKDCNNNMGTQGDVFQGNKRTYNNQDCNTYRLGNVRDIINGDRGGDGGSSYLGGKAGNGGPANGNITYN